MQENDLVCTLTADDYRDRETAWLKVGSYMRASAAIPGGLSFRFAPTRGLRDSMTELVRLRWNAWPGWRSRCRRRRTGFRRRTTPTAGMADAPSARTLPPLFAPPAGRN